MVHCCVVECKNKQGCGASFFLFPHGATKKKLRQQWIVNVGRVENKGQGTGVGKLWSPKKAYVCSEHFTPESFTKDPRILESIGFKNLVGLRLKSDAVPTIFPTKDETSRTDRGAFHKRENQRVSIIYSFINKLSRMKNL